MSCLHDIEAETRMKLTALAMSVYFLQERKGLLVASQYYFVYVLLDISVLLSCGHLELQGRLSIYLAFQVSVVGAGKGERDWE